MADRNLPESNKALKQLLTKSVRRITVLERLVGQTPNLMIGATADRPDAAIVGAGTSYYDTTLKKPIWSDGVVWRDAAGSAV